MPRLVRTALYRETRQELERYLTEYGELVESPGFGYRYCPKGGRAMTGYEVRIIAEIVRETNVLWAKQAYQENDIVGC